MDEAFRKLSLELAGRHVFALHPVYQFLERTYLGPIMPLHRTPSRQNRNGLPSAPYFIRISRP